MKQKQFKESILYVIFIVAGIVYLGNAFYQNDGTLHADNIMLFGIYLFFVLWSVFSRQEKKKHAMLRQKIYKEKNMDAYLSYHEKRKKKAVNKNMKEFETVQIAIGHAYKGELKKAEEMIISLKKDGVFSAYIHSNAIINLYIIYLYQENLQKAKDFYQENEDVFEAAKKKHGGFTSGLWGAYEAVLLRDYKTGRKMLQTFPKEFALSNDVYKMLMSKILKETASKEVAKEYMEACLKTPMFPFMKAKVLELIQTGTL